MNTKTAHIIYSDVINMSKRASVLALAVKMQKKAQNEVTKTTTTETTPDPMTPPKPSYMDTLKNYYNDTVNFVKDRWDKTAPDAKDALGYAGSGAVGATVGMGIGSLIPAVRRNKLLQAIMMLGGFGAGAGLRYLATHPNTPNINLPK